MMKTLEMKGKSRWHLRTIRQFESDFDLREFAEFANQLYIDVHNALADRDMKKIQQLVCIQTFIIVIIIIVHNTIIVVFFF